MGGVHLLIEESSRKSARVFEKQPIVPVLVLKPRLVA